MGEAACSGPRCPGACCPGPCCPGAARTVAPRAPSRTNVSNCARIHVGCGRDAGSRCNSGSITAANGRARSGSVIAPKATACSTAVTAVRWNSDLPSRAATSSAPSDHRSAAGPPSSPCNRSGAVNSGEPRNAPASVSVASPSIRAMPKSVSTQRSLARSQSTLAGLTSRCRTPMACAAQSASSTARPIRAASRGGSGPSPAIRAASEAPSTSSITIHGRPSCSTTSWTPTTLGCVTRATACASRSVRFLCSASNRPPRGCTSLTATGRPSSRSSARQTVPIPPRPSCATRRYRPATIRSPSDTPPRPRHPRTDRRQPL